MTGFRVMSFGSAAKASALIMDSDIHNPHGYGFSGGMRVIGGETVVDTLKINDIYSKMIKHLVISDNIKYTKPGASWEAGNNTYKTFVKLEFGNLVPDVENGINIQTVFNVSSTLYCAVYILVDSTTVYTGNAITGVPQIIDKDIIFCPTTTTATIEVRFWHSNSATAASFTDLTVKYDEELIAGSITDFVTQHPAIITITEV